MRLQLLERVSQAGGGGYELGNSSAAYFIIAFTILVVFVWRSLMLANFFGCGNINDQI
jgi:hypothetical protein